MDVGQARAQEDRIIRAAESVIDEAVEFTRDLIRIPTVNPPGEFYEDGVHCVGKWLTRAGFTSEYIAAEGMAEHTAKHPRLNVIGRREGARPGKTLHLNGHVDVVPAGGGWTLDPFGAEVADGRIYGRGTCDMKAGIAAAIFAAEALRRAGVATDGAIEISGTVDEESGGDAGVAYLCKTGRVTAQNTQFVIIPEPLNVDRICVGHRGVYWFDVVTHGRIAHGSMPYLGHSAIDDMGAILEAIRTELQPELLKRRTKAPVVPELSRHATLNVNTVSGGQVGEDVQSPCVADRALAIFDRRFLLEEGFDATKAEIQKLLDSVAARVPGLRYELRDRMVVHPTATPENSPVTLSLQAAIARVLNKEAQIIASPGTYDQKHFDRIGHIPHTVAYGPGVLDLAHQPDEWVAIEDLKNSIAVLAIATTRLLNA
ncbi:MAG: acetylornithine deacetylase/succinyl-diaminopimelate desuccinylase family protein [Vicinamibacteria bacterium]|nr:acetylornithine deacetylase/succinyl-diaminopimelate desuccinylase family protein [Vicinamibacteria bacterium]